MQMKKFLIVTAVILAILLGLFLWKGGHHALFLAHAVDEWLDMDYADQTLTLQFDRSDFSVNSANGQIKSSNEQWSLTADSFWTEYENERILGLTAEGITAYLSSRNLFLDTGKAYSLPEMPELKDSVKRLALGMLLYGRVTKSGDTYHISMKSRELELSATVDAATWTVRIEAVLPDQTRIQTTLTSKDPVPHPVPEAVALAMERTRSEAPMPLTEPLEVLLPATEHLLPLSGDLKLGVSCGILELSETVQLAVNDNGAALTRNGKSLELALPVQLSQLPPAAIAAMLLRNGEFTKTQDGALFTINLPAEGATELLGALVPQAAELGIGLGDSALVVCITEGRLASLSLTAEGSVPFLFTEIPVEFSAELTVT